MYHYRKQRNQTDLKLYMLNSILLVKHVLQSKLVMANFIALILTNQPLVHVRFLTYKLILGKGKFHVNIDFLFLWLSDFQKKMKSYTALEIRNI